MKSIDDDRKKIVELKGKTYKDLNVYQLSYKLGLEIHKLAIQFPDYEQYAISRQLRNSAMSIPVNIAEGMSKQLSASDIVRFLKIAKGSCEETKVWLSYAKDLNYLSVTQFDKLISDYEQVGKMLTGLIKYWTLKI